MEAIQVRGAAVHNLKNADADFPIGEISVVCGVSGGGKSSLVLDVLHAESRRRYLETLGSRAAAILGGPKFVPVQAIHNLRPSIALECGDRVINPKSTVASLAEISPMLRILYAECANAVCPKCGQEMRSLTAQKIVEELSALPNDTKVQIVAPVFTPPSQSPALTAGLMPPPVQDARRTNGGTFFTPPSQSPPSSVMAGDQWSPLQFPSPFSPLPSPISPTLKELAKIYLAQGFVRAVYDDKDISLDFVKPEIENIVPKKFSIVIDRIVVKQNQRTRLSEAVNACLRLSGNSVVANDRFFSTIPRCETHGITAENFSTSNFSVWSANGQCSKCKGNGLIDSENGERLECPECGGLQLKNKFLNCVWEKLSWRDLHLQPIFKLKEILPPLLEKVPHRLKTALLDIPLRISILCELGLGHLSLGRLGETLSSGEAQRTRLAALCTGHLNGVLLCIDEPASGLHEKDVEKLWKVLLQLKRRQNTLVLIEHHPLIINRADWIVEVGPGAGEFGGEIVRMGKNSPTSTLQEKKAKESKFLANKVKNGDDEIRISGARVHNLKNLTVQIPVGKLTLICGVSGSGKSSLLWGSIAPLISAALDRSPNKKITNEYGTLENFKGIENILCARTGRAFAQKRSSIATATGIMQIIKDLFASIPESKIRGYTSSTFGTDKQGGRCEECKGDGFLLDPSGYEESECPICQGKKFKDEILEIRFKLMSVFDVLELSVSQAMKIFANFEKITSKLNPLVQTGLHYLRLGQPTTHLSGGELGRLRLSQDLAKTKIPKTLYLFDEPARGLSSHDTEFLLALLRGLTEKGHTVIAIEHNSAFRSAADYIIELDDGNMLV
ncbi:hypothetical protein AGMMS49938_12820 [Fibrobacterales bacterium]|nr:hypothetical protein AGMMS49938_12820 [Fibrobacterales bacterium]